MQRLLNLPVGKKHIIGASLVGFGIANYNEVFGVKHIKLINGEGYTFFPILHVNTPWLSFLFVSAYEPGWFWSKTITLSLTPIKLEHIKEK